MVKRLSAYPEKVWVEKLRAFRGGGVLSPCERGMAGAGGEEVKESTKRRERKRDISTSQFLAL